MSLSLLYRQGKPVFLLFAALVAIQRVISQNHFPSDVIAGALVGVVSAQTMLVLMQQRLEAGAQKTKPAEQIESGHPPTFSGTSPV